MPVCIQCVERLASVWPGSLNERLFLKGRTNGINKRAARRRAVGRSVGRSVGRIIPLATKWNSSCGQASRERRGLRTCLSSGVATPTPTSMPHRPRLRPRFDRYLAASTKFANWKRRLIRWMSIRDFRFYGLIGVYKYTSCVCVSV